MKRILFATVGVGRGVDGPIAHAIHHFNPELSVLLTTARSRELILPALFDRLGWQADDPRLEVPLNPAFEAYEDLEQLQLVYQQTIEAYLRQHRVDAGDCVVDFTSGTKAMSAAVSAAGYAVGVGRISYVVGERDDTGRVIAGTERIHTSYGRRLRARQQLDEALALFDAGRYAASRDLAASLADVPDIFLPFAGQLRTLVEQASEALIDWDRFRIEEAAQRLQELGQLDPQIVARLLPKKARLEIQRLLTTEHRDVYCAERFADLIANADRRIDACSFDDAMGRLYRATEYLGQLLLHEKHGLHSNNVPAERLPEQMRDASKDDDAPVKLPLRKTWDFLRLHEDPVAERFHQLLASSNLEAALNQRNDSLLAHGFQPISEKYVHALRDGLDDLARLTWGEKRWRALLDTCRFPSFGER